MAFEIKFKGARSGVVNFLRKIFIKQPDINIPKEYISLFEKVEYVNEENSTININNGHKAKLIGLLKDKTIGDIKEYLPEKLKNNEQYIMALSSDIDEFMQTIKDFKNSKEEIIANVQSEKGVYKTRTEEEKSEFINFINNYEPKLFVVSDKNNEFQFIYIKMQSDLRSDPIKFKEYYNSPEKDKREKYKSCFNGIMLHHSVSNLSRTIMIFQPSKITLLSDPSKEREVSAQYIISKSGIVIQMVDASPLSKKPRAFHAGFGSYGQYFEENGSLNNSIGNDTKIGIEHINDGIEEFSEHQINASLNLTQYLKDSNPNITTDNIISHEQYSPGRKFDPHTKFPIEKFIEKGLYLPINMEYIKKVRLENPETQDSKICSNGDKCKEVEGLKHKLTQAGYFVVDNTKADMELYPAIKEKTKAKEASLEELNSNTPEEWHTLGANIATFKRTFYREENPNTDWFKSDDIILDKVIEEIQQINQKSKDQTPKTNFTALEAENTNPSAIITETSIEQVKKAEIEKIYA